MNEVKEQLEEWLNNIASLEQPSHINQIDRLIHDSHEWELISRAMASWEALTIFGLSGPEGSEAIDHIKLAFPTLTGLVQTIYTMGYNRALHEVEQSAFIRQMTSQDTNLKGE